MLKVNNRLSYVQWGNDDMAVAMDYWWNTRNTKAYLFNPSNAKAKTSILVDRNYQDRYSDPGDFVTEKNEFGSFVMSINKGKAYLIGDGYSEKDNSLSLMS